MVGTRWGPARATCFATCRMRYEGGEISGAIAVDKRRGWFHGRLCGKKLGLPRFVEGTTSSLESKTFLERNTPPEIALDSTDILLSI